jgi:hypothetical protein
VDTEKVCGRCAKHCVPAQSYCPKCGSELPKATPVPPGLASSAGSKPERVPLSDVERAAAERDLMTSEVWRESLGYDPNTADHLLPPGAIRISLIEYAAELGKLYGVKVALNRGADPNQQSHQFGTVLHAAARKGHLQIVRLLLEQGAEAKRTDESGKTAAEVAAEAGYQSVAEYLNSLP